MTFARNWQQFYRKGETILLKSVAKVLTKHRRDIVRFLHSVSFTVRADAESQYAKHLSKLSAKLSRACRDGGDAVEGWRGVANELGARADAHRLLGRALSEEAARPLRTLTEVQHRARKQCEGAVDKAARSLGEWRAAEAKAKKQSHTCARDNERLQDAAGPDGRCARMT